MKTILITGASDGIGRETARRLATEGHHLLLHGRDPGKLDAAASELRAIAGAGPVETYRAEMSQLGEVAGLAEKVAARHDRLDVLINNAGVLKSADARLPGGLDLRFAVNTLAPALLTRRLLPSIPAGGRIIHLSSAAQAPVDLGALTDGRPLAAMDAYAQSKLALTIWSQALAAELGPDGPVTVAVNPGSLLATRMVKEGFGVAGNDIGIGADILVRAALSDAFAGASGRYFDNDAGRFAQPQAEAGDRERVRVIVEAIEGLIADHLPPRR
ncbi:SDR family NAD(P)-dependent oxidoreductase [Profundibacterium mesophilum]|uniref:1-deoxy-D-xylulose-5-phosphate reductoisomerase n=1 Tax=Profundibacterium mesophilum KAUST100406-0324 TaxID=1037889 RepID=A0A921TD60_9RHOB|nr:SDR family NAD(P)-dependent oxidoreductase [Profundibacterium mesophilum]KAF0675961.1 1-deoxy-D-xylulose-5-phosphate reductoisomerase [Profundibacterium mesophilum KAUST100406-0324]